MKKERLNHNVVKSLEPEEDKYIEYWESSFYGGSFGVRVSPKTHRKKFVLQYVNNKRKQKRMTLGEFNPGGKDHMSVSEARDKARRIISEVNKGNEPAGKRSSTNQTTNFEDLVKTFFNTYGQENLSDSTLQEYRRMAEKDLIPNWGNMKPQEISRSEIIHLLEQIAEERGARTIADRTRSLIHKIFNWAIERDILDSNPCSGVSTRGDESRRERTLNPDEISDLWLATDSENEPFRSLTRFILLTGQRFGETRKAKWSHIYDEPTIGCQVWKIPEDNAKNGRPNLVPLPPLANQVLDEIRECISSESDYIFASPKKDEKPVKWLQNARERLCEELNYDQNKNEEGFRFHDLRRTCANGLDNLGIDRITVGKLLNHKSIDQSVTAGYIPRKRLREKKEAIFKWNDHISEIIGLEYPEKDFLKKEESRKLEDRVQQLEDNLQEIDVDPEVQNEIDTQLDTIRTQLNSNEPSEVIIQECKKKIRQTLGEEVGENRAEELVSDA